MRKVLSDMKCIKYNCTTLYKVLSDIQYTKNHCTTLYKLLSDRECRLAEPELLSQFDDSQFKSRCFVISNIYNI